MWDLIKELFGSDKSWGYRLALGLVLGGIALFAVWTSFPSSVRETVLRAAIKPGSRPNPERPKKQGIPSKGEYPCCRRMSILPTTPSRVIRS